MVAVGFFGEAFALAVVEVRLLLKYIRIGLPEVEPVKQITDDDDVLSFAY